MLVTMFEDRSEFTQGHSKRVSEVAVRLGRKLGLTGESLQDLRLGTLLHDIGKIAIPDAILNKPGKHTPEESQVMRTHAEIGHQMLDRSPREVLRLAAEIALSHHENWDGSGYPQGLRGEDIPISGRITMLADVFDALGSDRCYKDAWEWERIKQFITEQRGVKFDPKLVDLLMDHWDEAVAIRTDLPD